MKLQADKIPDHSVLELQYAPYIVLPMINNFSTLVPECTEKVAAHKHNLQNIHGNFLNNDDALTKIVNLISQMLEVKSSQEHVDVLYQQFCDIYYYEINCYLKPLNASPKIKKIIKFKSKPFWNNTYDHLWHEIAISKKQYLKPTFM